MYCHMNTYAHRDRTWGRTAVSYRRFSTPDITQQQRDRKSNFPSDRMEWENPLNYGLRSNNPRILLQFLNYDYNMGAITDT